ncbi:MAG: hypothetical protein ABIH23_13655, partial [bacterium]
MKKSKKGEGDMPICRKIPTVMKILAFFRWPYSFKKAVFLAAAFALLSPILDAYLYFYCFRESGHAVFWGCSI